MSFLRSVDPDRAGHPARQGGNFSGQSRRLSRGSSGGRVYRQRPGHGGGITIPSGPSRPARQPLRQHPGHHPHGPTPTVVHRGPTLHHHRSPLFIDPTVTHLPSVHTHETVIVDSGSSHSVTVVDGKSRGKVAMIAALIVGILFAVLGASPFSSQSGCRIYPHGNWWRPCILFRSGINRYQIKKSRVVCNAA